MSTTPDDFVDSELISDCCSGKVYRDQSDYESLQGVCGSCYEHCKAVQPE